LTPKLRRHRAADACVELDAVARIALPRDEGEIALVGAKGVEPRDHVACESGGEAGWLRRDDDLADGERADRAWP
jgi:hypothetical protein